MELENVEFIINDGQHRCAAIAAALKDNPALGKDTISVLVFETENLDRLQQMFSDLNRFAHKTSKSLDILYDHRDNLSALTMDVSEQVEVFKGMVDKEKITIPLRSSKLFTLATLYDGNEELLGQQIDKRGSKGYADKLRIAVDYWTEVSKIISDWRKVKDGDLTGCGKTRRKTIAAKGKHYYDHESGSWINVVRGQKSFFRNLLKATQLRQEKINTHAVVMRALGGVGKALLDAYPKVWRPKLVALGEVDWRKSVGSRVNPTWDNVCITAGSVVSNRQARAQTLFTLKRLLGLVQEQKTAPNGSAAQQLSNQQPGSL